jgi:hypothetical protein
MKAMITAIVLTTIILGTTVQLQVLPLEVLGTDSLGNQLIYDPDLDITKYDYTHEGDAWQNQNCWASNLVVDINGQSIAG